MSGRPIVLLGMLTKMPVGGVIWQTVHYLEGLRRLGYDPHYVEAHARTPSSFVQGPGDQGSVAAAAFLDRVMRRFGFGSKWALHALHDDGACYGLSRTGLNRLYDRAAALLNLHGGTRPLPEHRASGQLIWIGTDPVDTEVELASGDERTRDFLSAHDAWFTFGENLGNPDCRVPSPQDFTLEPTRQPVVLDFWPDDSGDRGVYTTVANWRQPFRVVWLDGERYSWSKHQQFLEFVNLPRRAPNRRFELALASYEPADRALLEERGWSVRDAGGVSADADTYRDFLATSRAEFTVAKEQNVRLRSGWFSDRSATYLAAGRPVITQDTGFGSHLPTGDGLFSFQRMEEVLAAILAIERDYPAARRAARAVATEHFAHDVVLPHLLERAGVDRPARSAVVCGPDAGPAGPDSFPTRTAKSLAGFPLDLRLEPESRRPLTLSEATLSAIRRAPPVRPPAHPTRPEVSVVVVTCGQAPLTRLCLETLLELEPAVEVIVVDNASQDGTRPYLADLASRDARVQPVFHDANLGFPAACNVGLERASADVLVLLNNDTLVTPGALERLREVLRDPAVGGVNPVTNRIGTEAEIPTDYQTLSGMLDLAGERRRRFRGQTREVGMLAMFCLGMRRETWSDIGPLDDGFGTGLFEDDDYTVRLKRAGLATVCAEDAFVHHFGEASFGGLTPGGAYGELFARNRARFEAKWGQEWTGHARREDEAYDALVQHVRRTASAEVPIGGVILVASRGDPRLVSFEHHDGWHFPRTDEGQYAGHYPVDGQEAIAQVNRWIDGGAGFLALPRPAFWWLDYYDELREALARTRLIHTSEELRLYDLSGFSEASRLDPSLTASDRSHT